MKKKIIFGILIFVLFLIVYKIFFSTTIAKTFPFSKADNIELLFYSNEQAGGTDLKMFHKIPLLKKVQLNENEKNEVFEILYKELCFMESSAACFNPRHALLFTKQKDTIGVLEICLECSRIEGTEGIKNPLMCDEMYYKLSAFINSKK